jgi:hypothetical protein
MDVDNLGENVPQGISISNGPVTQVSSDEENGSRRNAKRKGRKPTVKEESSASGSDSDAPLVRDGRGGIGGS